MTFWQPSLPVKWYDGLMDRHIKETLPMGGLWDVDPVQTRPVTYVCRACGRYVDTFEDIIPDGGSLTEGDLDILRHAHRSYDGDEFPCHYPSLHCINIGEDAVTYLNAYQTWHESGGYRDGEEWYFLRGLAIASIPIVAVCRENRNGHVRIEPDELELEVARRVIARAFGDDHTFDTFIEPRPARSFP